MRLIDADALLSELNNLEVNCKNKYVRQGVDDGLHYYMPRILENEPTINAVPIRRGKWKLNKDGSGTCDQCHCTQDAVWDMDNWQNFCGHCGADMREG